MKIPAVLFVEAATSVMPAACSDMTSPAIHAVHIRPDFDCLKFEATNRYVLAEHTVSLELEADTPAVTVPLTAMKSALAVIKATGATEVEVTAETVAGIPFRYDHEFPRTGALWPGEAKFAPAAGMVLDLDRITELAGPKVKGKRAPLQFTFTGEVKPILVHRHGVDNFRGLLMPIRPA